jgi:hypothetical protein
MASQSNSIVNPGVQSRYSVQLSEDLLDTEKDFAPLSTVKFNHKPSQNDDSSRTTRITSSGPGTFALNITDKDDGKTSVYHYGGQRGASKKSYVLVFDPEQQTCTLQPVSESYSFNLKSTPWQPSAEVLNADYPQIQEEALVEDDQIDPLGGIPDSEIEEDNPFDYRRHLLSTKDKSPSPSPGLLALPKPANHASSKSRDRSRSAPEAPERFRKALPKKQRPTPAVRLERRASTRDVHKNLVNKKGTSGKDSRKLKPVPDIDELAPNHVSAPSDIEEQDDDDDYNDTKDEGFLEIEYGDEPPPSQRPRALTLPGSTHRGPISLRSAANSPSSQINTIRRSRGDHDGLVIDFGESDNYGGDDVDMSDANGDEDVEPISLGSPAHAQGEDYVNGADNDMDLDADFAAEMMQGLASQDDDEPIGQSHVQDSESEESEAE